MYSQSKQYLMTLISHLGSRYKQIPILVDTSIKRIEICLIEIIFVSHIRIKQPTPVS